MSGRSRNNRRNSFQIVTASFNEISRLISGMYSGVTPVSFGEVTHVFFALRHCTRDQQ